MKKYLLMAFIVLILSQVSMAQEHKSENVVAYIVPQYLFTNGIRLDIDLRKPESNKWWVISPYYYSDGSNSSFLNQDGLDYNPRKYENMYGIGIGIARKIFLKSNSTAKGFYAMAGLTYKYFNIQGDNLTYVETTGDDGLTYFEMQDLKYTININSYSGYAVLGHQFNPFSKFYIDLFMGFGLRYSSHNSPEKAAIKYNRGNIDYGYSGTHFVGGARLGITLF